MWISRKLNHHTIYDNSNSNIIKMYLNKVNYLFQLLYLRIAKQVMLSQLILITLDCSFRMEFISFIRVEKNPVLFL